MTKGARAMVSRSSPQWSIQVLRRGACHLSVVVLILLVLPTLAACVDESTTEDSSVYSGVRRSALRQLEQIDAFGSNPGGLKMFEYVPADIPAGPRPLVVALHGCMQTAQEYMNTGWNEIADELGFYVLYPQQSAQNNQMKCFNWGGGWAGMPSALVPDSTSADLSYIERGAEENMSIIEMIESMRSRYDIDPGRIYVTGVSSGGGMTALMLALWPEVFAGGSIIAGVPYGCNFEQQTTGEAKRCLQASVNRTPEQWGDYVRTAYAGYDGPLPLVAVWHGTSDQMVNYSRLAENVEQWTNVHGIDATPDATQTEGRVTLEEHWDSEGAVVVRAHTVQNMPHGVPVNPAESCGSTHWSIWGSYFHAVGLCAAWDDALFWGLDQEPSHDEQPEIEEPIEDEVDDDPEPEFVSDPDPAETPDETHDDSGGESNQAEQHEVSLGCLIVSAVLHVEVAETVALLFDL